jgi:hypothetical protein
VEFGVRGKGDVHLSGYIEDEGVSEHSNLNDSEPPSAEDEEEEAEEKVLKSFNSIKQPKPQ